MYKRLTEDKKIVDKYMTSIKIKIEKLGGKCKGYSRMSEQRKNRRLNCTVPVEGKEGGLFEQTQTVDFCKEGLGFISAVEIPVNQEIAIEIDLGPDQDPVLVIGKVKWVHHNQHEKNYRIGMYFADILKGSKTRLNKYFSRI